VTYPLIVVLRCADTLKRKVRYVFDTLLMARGIPVRYDDEPPADGLWLLYGASRNDALPMDRCLAIAHCADAWRLFEGREDAHKAVVADDLVTVFGETVAGFERPNVPFDMVANAFYFLSSWSERVKAHDSRSRRLYADSVYARLDVPQDIVDQYLGTLIKRLDDLCERHNMPRWPFKLWPTDATYALVLSHDIDYIPAGLADTALQGARTVLRHLIRHRDAGDALLAGLGLARALLTGRDAYGCVPEIIDREKQLGVRASFQVAVGHMHPADVNYRIEDDRVRDYLRAIPDSDFDLCLHGSYRSTENFDWYVEEVALLTKRLGHPLGSRQHFLSFNYDTLFSAQEASGVQFDMSMGYPDRIGPRAGFSYPYFPFCLEKDKPFDVVEISLFYMDVTLRSYMGMKRRQAWDVLVKGLDRLSRVSGCVSVVWHPIVFGGARDPGYDQLFWDMVKRVRDSGGIATDGNTINAFWRERARAYPSFT
jgi:hypothetical protein